MIGLLAVNTAVSTQSSILSGIRLNRMKIYAIGGATAALPFSPATVSVTWLSNYGPSSEISDTGNSFEPACVTVTPPPMSLASFWTLVNASPSTEVLCTVSVPAGAIIDIWVDLVLYDGEVVFPFTTTAVGTVGQLYAGYLDRHVGAAATMIPVSYQSLL